MVQKQKPWYRPRNVLMAIACVVILVFGWAYWEVMTVYHAEPNPTLDSRARLQRLSEEWTGVSPDAGRETWLLLVEIFDGVQSVTDEVNALFEAGVFTPRDEYDLGEVDYSRPLEGRTLPDDIAPERQALELMGARGTFELLAHFAARPLGIRPMRGGGQLDPGESLPILGRAQELGWGLVSSMRIAVADCRPVELAAAFDQVLALSLTMSYQPILISHLTGAAIEALALRELRYELIETRLDGETCRSLLESLDRQQQIADQTYLAVKCFANVTELIIAIVTLGRIKSMTLALFTAKRGDHRNGQ